MRPISFEDDLSRLIDQAQPSLLFEGSTPEDFCVWQEGFRDVLTGLIGPRPERAAGAIEDLFVDRFDGGHQFNMTVAQRVLERLCRG